MNSRMLFLVILGACATGSTDKAPPSNTDTGDFDWEPLEFLDEGDVCFGNVDANTESTLQITMMVCMSSSCSRAFEGECTATVEGSEITLTNRFSWEEAVGNIPCTDDCGIPTTACELEGLADGEYNVTLGDQTFTLTVPQVEDCGY